MTLSVVHSTVATLPDEPGAEINKSEWNDEHSLTGFGTAAEADASDFATAAQGALADTALQPGDPSIPTTETIQDIVGAMATDSGTIDFTYDDSAGTVTAIVKDGSITEAKLLLSDNTTDDVSTTKHGFVPKAPNDTAKFLRGDATWAVPSATAPVVSSVAYSASLSLDWNGVDEIRVDALTGNIDITGMTNMVDGKRYVLKLVQDGTGGRTVTFSSANIRFSEDMPSVWYSATASKASLFGFRYDGADSKADLVAQVAGY